MSEIIGTGSQTRSKTLTLTRILNAPREVVFKAWTRPEHVAKWFAPEGFTIPECTMDVRVGGEIRTTMEGLGMRIPSKGVFRELAPPDRLSFTSSAFEDENGIPQLETMNTVTLVERNGKTEMTVHVVVLKATEAVNPALAGMEVGWNQTLNNFERELPHLL